MVATGVHIQVIATLLRGASINACELRGSAHLLIRRPSSAHIACKTPSLIDPRAC